MTRIVSASSREPAGWGERARTAAFAACVLAGLSLLAGCAWLDAKERTIIYRPTPGRPDGFTGLRAGDENYLISVPGDQPGTIDQLAIWWLPTSNRAAPTLLYLHGTFRNLYRNHPKIEALREAGFDARYMNVGHSGWRAVGAPTKLYSP